MIRLRVGQKWKREGAAAAIDFLALDLDDVDILSDAAAEPLHQVVPDWVDAVHALAYEGQALTQLSLPEAHLEVCMVRRESDAELAIVSLARPARLTRKPVRVDLTQLCAASARAARALAEDLRSVGHDITPRLRKMLRQAGTLERSALPHLDPSKPKPFSISQPPEGKSGFGFQLDDSDDRLARWKKDAAGPLTSLLVPGRVWLVRDGKGVWSSSSPVALTVLELGRQAADLVHAIELGEQSATLKLAGEGPPHTMVLDAEGRALVRAMLEVGVSWSLALAQRNRAQAANPYVQELVARAKESLAQLKEAAPDPKTPKRSRARKKSHESKPLEVAGRLKRLRFAPLWEKQGLASNEAPVLLAGSRGPVVASGAAAFGFRADGSLRFRRVASHGVAVTGEGHALLALRDRMLAFVEDEAGARWLRDHDGLGVGPSLIRADGIWIGLSEGRAAFAYSEITGREIWRVAPPRTQQCFLSAHGHRALLATDSGYLYGLDIASGDLRFRIRSALPFLSAPVAWGRRVVAALGRGGRLAVLVADAHAGSIHWTTELPLTLPSSPLPMGTRVLIAGEQSSEGALICLDAKGHSVWERELHLGPGPYSIRSVGRDVLVSSRQGAATLVGVSGDVRWHLGAIGEPLNRVVSAALSRKILIVPGETVRAVDPRSGHVLAEVKCQPTLTDLHVDAKLNLYLLDEDGTLRAFKLTTQLSVLNGS